MISSPVIATLSIVTDNRKKSETTDRTPVAGKD
jgi:hypothetical protein